MKSRLLLNLALLAIVVVLGIMITLDDSDQKNKPATLSKLKLDEVNHILITHADRVVEINKSDKHWYLDKPLHIKANAFRINSILKILSANTYGNYSIDKLDLKQFDLDQPRTHIRINDLDVAFGNTNPMNKYRYVLANNHVYLMDDAYLPLLNSQIGTLVDPSALPADSKVKRMVLPEHTITLNEQGEWTSEPALATDDIMELLTNWKAPLAFGVHDYLERKNLGSVSITLDDDSVIEYTITDTDPWLIIARKDIGMEYHYNTDMYDKLLRPGNKPLPPDESTDKENPDKNTTEETTEIEPGK